MTEPNEVAADVRAQVDEFRRKIGATREEIGRAIIGNREVVDGVLTYILDEPFVVLATQNPLEMEGTYPLPEAQLDRFLFKLYVPFPNRDELHKILDLTTGAAQERRTPILDKESILTMQRLVRQVPV